MCQVNRKTSVESTPAKKSWLAGVTAGTSTVADCNATATIEMTTVQAKVRLKLGCAARTMRGDSQSRVADNKKLTTSSPTTKMSVNTR
jgi:hypothetical protein